MAPTPNVAIMLRLCLLIMFFCLRSALAQNDSFSYCTSSSDCEEYCVQLYNSGTVYDCYFSLIPCFCFNDYPDDCITSEDCYPNEDCIEFLPQSAAHYCVPCYLTSQINPKPVILGKAAVCNTPTPTPTIAPTPNISDNTFKECSRSDDCSGEEEECLRVNPKEGDLETCNSTTDCFCIEEENCRLSLGCPYGTVCVSFVENSVNAYCVTCEAYNKRSSELYIKRDEHVCKGGDYSSSSICIAITHLSDMPQSDLVFGTHRRAFVLCDHFDSCATPGHIIVYNDRPMMMSTYCSKYAAGGCSKRVTLVNSPRMQSQLRVPSSTSGLYFTAMAAKYETSLEERVLKGLIRIGF